MPRRSSIFVIGLASLLVAAEVGCSFASSHSTATPTPSASAPAPSAIATETVAATPSPSPSPLSLGCPAAPPSAAVAPAPRIGAAMSYDPATRSVLLFSGVTWEEAPCPNGTIGNRIFQDMWSWDGVRWSQMHPSVLPPGRSRGAMTYDQARNTTILVGGGDPNSDPQRSDTWAWRGGTWTDVTTAQNPYGGPTAYDPALGSVVLFRRSILAWNGSTWVDHAAAHQPLGGVPVIAYDAINKKLLVFMAASPGVISTWTWDGNDFREEHPVHQPPVGAANAVYDPARGVVVAFVAGETWTWNGIDWTQQHPPTAPTPRYFASMAYDPVLDQVLLFGGKVDAGPSTRLNNELWGWDGTTWMRLD